MIPETMHFSESTLNILDQRRLPGSVEYFPCRTAEETARAIECLAVRGAPAIGIAAAYGVSMSVIVEENGLASPDSIRGGQKLFIPD